MAELDNKLEKCLQIIDLNNVRVFVGLNVGRVFGAFVGLEAGRVFLWDLA